jgi:hypothetical protein
MVDWSARYGQDLDRDVGFLTRAWLRTAYEDVIEERDRSDENWANARLALRSWIERYGSLQDLELIRNATWALSWPARRDTTSPADVDLMPYLLLWDREAAIPALKQESEELLEKLLPQTEYLEVLTRQYRRNRYNRRSWGTLERYRYTQLNGMRISLISNIVTVAEAGDVDALDLFRRASRLMRSTYIDYYGGHQILTAFADLGRAGHEELERMFNSNRAIPSMRVQAGLILVRHGRDDLAADTLRLWQLYHDSGSSFWYRSIPSAFLILVSEGHMQFADPIMDVANKAGTVTRFRGRWMTGMYGYEFGTSYWNTGIVEALQKGSGEDFGWDLKAWTRWWEREKERLAAGNN